MTTVNRTSDSEIGRITEVRLEGLTLRVVDVRRPMRTLSHSLSSFAAAAVPASGCVTSVIVTATRPILGEPKLSRVHLSAEGERNPVAAAQTGP